jgi:ABC-2 type transport system ATP-binding protein
VARLTARGLRVVVDGAAVLVDLVDEAPFDIVRDTVVELDLALVRMEQRRHRLEDLFRDEPAATQPVAPPAAGR